MRLMRYLAKLLGGARCHATEATVVTNCINGLVQSSPNSFGAVNEGQVIHGPEGRGGCELVDSASAHRSCTCRRLKGLTKEAIGAMPYQAAQ